jgi:uncharacterized cupin superfamily protein
MNFDADTAPSPSVEAASLKPAPIEPSWILGGAPRARCAVLSRSRDKSASTVVWDCTAGEFNWSYIDDETVHILEGEAIVDDGSGPRTIRPGDVVLFHAGSTWRWRVPKYVKKVAFLRLPIPRPTILGIRAFRKLKGILSGKPQQPALACLATCCAAELSTLVSDYAPLWP